MKPIDRELLEKLRPFERRAMWVAFIKAIATSGLVIALAVEIGAAAGTRDGLALRASIGLALAWSIAYAFRKRPTGMDLARRIDARARLNDLVVTAIEVEGAGLPSAVRRAGLTALSRVAPALVYPIELPRRWRHGLTAAALVQVIVLPFALRLPAPRAPQPGATALVIPSGATGPARAQNQARQDLATPASLTPASAGAPNTLPAGLSLREAPAGAETELAAGTARVRSGSASDSARLAADSAALDIASGRVPIARRAIVEKYFASMQTRGKKRP
jgi:hypothetical protein